MVGLRGSRPRLRATGADRVDRVVPKLPVKAFALRIAVRSRALKEGLTQPPARALVWRLRGGSQAGSASSLTGYEISVGTGPINIPVDKGHLHY